MNYSLSDSDIESFFNNRVKILTYKEIYSYKTIDQLLSPYDVVFILFESTPRNGHWTLLFKRNNYEIEFFDSYGLVVDDELSYIDDRYKEELRENYKYLSHLIYLSPYELEYNNYEFQLFKKGVNTCGRWVILRYQYKNLPIDVFHEVLESVKEENNMTFDQIVVELVK